MRKTGNATQIMWDEYNAAYQDYEDRKEAYDSLSFWKRLSTSKPYWNATKPGFYSVDVYHYYDKVEQEYLRSEPGPWALFEFNHFSVNDYSVEWYTRRDRQVQQQREYDRQLVSSVWRANAGADYYSSAHPEYWQRDPGRY